MQVSKKISAGEKTVGKGDKEKTVTWPEGQIALNVPDLSEYSPEQLEKFAYNAAKLALQYSPSTIYRNSGGTPKDSTEGQFVCKDGVFAFNPDFKVGLANSKFDKKVAEMETLKGRKLTSDELDFVRSILS